MRVGQWLGKSPWCKPSEGWRQEMQRLDRQQSEALATGEGHVTKSLGWLQHSTLPSGKHTKNFENGDFP